MGIATDIPTSQNEHLTVTIDNPTSYVKANTIKRCKSACAESYIASGSGKPLRDQPEFSLLLRTTSTQTPQITCSTRDVDNIE